MDFTHAIGLVKRVMLYLPHTSSPETIEFTEGVACEWGAGNWWTVTVRSNNSVLQQYEQFVVKHQDYEGDVLKRWMLFIEYKPITEPIEPEWKGEYILSVRTYDPPSDCNTRAVLVCEQRSFD